MHVADTLEVDVTTSVPLVVTPSGVVRSARTDVDVDVVVADAANDAGHTDESHDVVSCSEVGEVRIDPESLRAVLDDMLGAALALAAPRSTVILAAVPTRASVVLSIEDDGPVRLDPTLDWLFDETPRSGLLDRGAARACTHLARLSRTVSTLGGLAWIEEGIDGGGCLVVELPLADPLVHSGPARGMG